MDVVSIAASLIAIGSAGCQTAIKLYTLAAQISTASDRISSISNDVSLTSTVLQQLGELMAQKVTDDGTSIFSQVGLETTRTSAVMCEHIFKEIEQAGKDASEQIRRRGRLVGKIELSKFERAKWPFLQPSIEYLRTDLREAKGTLMLMLQVTSLAFSKKIADFHQNTSTHIVEQRDTIQAILELSKQTQLEAPTVNSSTNRTPRPASPHRVRRKPLLLDERPTLVQNPGSSSAALPPIRTNTLMMHPEQKMPDQNPFRRAPGRPQNDQIDNLSTEYSTRNIQDKGCGAGAVSEGSDSLRDGSLCTPAKSSTGDPNVGSKRLDGFTMKPVIQDFLDAIQLSWKIHKVQMEQADIQRQMIKNEEEGLSAVFETYQELYAHEYRALENQISQVGADASLISLKKTYTDMRHREILFKGVPGLQFVLMKEVKKDEEDKVDKARSKEMYSAQGYGEERIKVMMKDSEKIETGDRWRSPHSADVLKALDAISPKEKFNRPATKLETSKAVHSVAGSNYLVSLRRARFIRSLKDVTYPQGIVCPKINLHVDRSNNCFRYDIKFLLQFKPIIKETPAEAVIHQLVLIPNEEAVQPILRMQRNFSINSSQDRSQRRAQSFARRQPHRQYEGKLEKLERKEEEKASVNRQRHSGRKQIPKKLANDLKVVFGFHIPFTSRNKQKDQKPKKERKPDERMDRLNIPEHIARPPELLHPPPLRDSSGPSMHRAAPIQAFFGPSIRPAALPPLQQHSLHRRQATQTTSVYPYSSTNSSPLPSFDLSQKAEVDDYIDSAHESEEEPAKESMNDEEAERVVNDLLGKYTTLFQS